MIWRQREVSVAGRDLLVWQQNTRIIRGGNVQRTNYYYLVRLPHGDEFFIQTEPFGAAICQLVLRTQLLEKLNQFDRGEVLTFGAIHLTPEAIFVKNKRIDWEKSPQFKISDGIFFLRGSLMFPSLKCSEIPNLDVLVGLLQDNDSLVNE